MMKPSYEITTDFTEYQAWPWFQEYLALSEAAPIAKDAKILPVSVGEAYCTWVLGTPEVRDIVYRGYVLHKVEDDLEDSLLGTSTRYFLLRNNISEKNSANLTACWQVLELILMGDLSPPPHEDVRDRLLRHSWAFKRV
ncbi:hypothetical protein [Roseovarius sp. THAF27]|uniref:hypothetical protein n=1 Tax=Roseovarius sp. THAF27 TaxID=2587850 RepID=UPI0012681268|nr:hypothetical protein [Roseovarius sp. THAF27]